MLWLRQFKRVAPCTLIVVLHHCDFLYTFTISKFRWGSHSCVWFFLLFDTLSIGYTYKCLRLSIQASLEKMLWTYQTFVGTQIQPQQWPRPWPASPLPPSQFLGMFSLTVTNSDARKSYWKCVATRHYISPTGFCLLCEVRLANLEDGSYANLTIQFVNFSRLCSCLRVMEIWTEVVRVFRITMHSSLVLFMLSLLRPKTR